jgi:hypothetical protein
VSLFYITPPSILNLASTDKPFGLTTRLTRRTMPKPRRIGGLVLRVPGVKSKDLLETKEPHKFPIEFDGTLHDTDTFDITIPAGPENRRGRQAWARDDEMEAQRGARPSRSKLSTRVLALESA